jgi:death-on-curing protein
VLRASGGGAGLRDRSLLESAVAAPQASFGGEALIRDTVEIAAAYLYYLCRNHPFVDGNKRTALATALVFLKANGRLKDLGQPEKRIDDWEALVLDVASSKLDRLEVARRLRVLLRRRR